MRRGVCWIPHTLAWLRISAEQIAAPGESVKTPSSISSLLDKYVENSLAVPHA